MGFTITIVKEYKPVGTSLEFRIIPGAIMKTRCGDIDSAIIPYLMEREKISFKEINGILYRKSSFMGSIRGSIERYTRFEILGVKWK